MSKTDSLQGSLDLLVLKILSRRPRLHGYAIMAAVASTSGEVLRAEEGSLYPALYRMEEAGWIRAEWIKKDTGRRARIYELTAAGKKQLGEEESRWESVSRAINRVLREACHVVVVAYLECFARRASEPRDRGRAAVAH
jgi:PadR family transcriptional regulator PadR